MSELVNILVIGIPILGCLITGLYYVDDFFRRRREAISSFRQHEREKRKQLLDVLEQNFDVLQRLNETALLSDENLTAAALSVNPNDTAKPEELRVVFFHYLRINRMFRLFEYKRLGFLPDEEFRRVFDSYSSTMLEIAGIIDELAPRGYPENFCEFLKEELSKKSVSRAPQYDTLKKRGK